MATINDVAELLSWGATPSWVENQFDKNYKSGTAEGTGKKQNGWGGYDTYTYTYTTYGLTDISTGSGSFNSSDWDSWSSSTQGSNGNKVYSSGGYGIELDDSSLTLTQLAADLTFGEAVVDVQTDTAHAASGSQTVSVIDNTEGSTDLTQEISFTALQEVSSGASVSNGYSNTTEMSVGTEVSAEFAGIGTSVNSSVTESTTINTSSTTDTNETDTVSQTITNTLTVPPGYKIQLTMLYQNQTATLPYTFPVKASGTSKYSDKWGNDWSVGVGDNINSSKDYGSPNADYMSASSSSEGTFLATGYITNINASNFTTKQTTLVKPPSASSMSAKSISSSFTKKQPRTDLPKVIKNGKVVNVGIHYDLSDTKHAEGYHLRGSNNNDIIRMGARNQTARTFGGRDMVFGSKYADLIISKGDDNIDSGKGADIIKSKYGSTDIIAGSGNDKVYITSKGGGHDDVTLGTGKDKINIDLNKDEDYKFVIRDLAKNEYVDITSDDSVTSKVVGNNIEVYLDGDYVGTIKRYVDQFTGLSLIKGADLGLMNMDKIVDTVSTATTAHWKDDLIAYSALYGWGDLTKKYRKFAKSGSTFTENSKALSKYMYDGEVIDEFVDAMNSVIGDKGIEDMSDHVATAISKLSNDQQEYFKPDTIL